MDSVLLDQCPKCKAKDKWLVGQLFNSMWLTCYDCGYKTESILAVNAIVELYRLRNLTKDMVIEEEQVMVNSAQLVQKLREETSAGIMQCKQALVEANGNINDAKEILISQGLKLVKKRSDKETRQGIIEAYVHPTTKIGVLMEFNCETDFVARSSAFTDAAHEICLQIAAMKPDNVEELMDQVYVRDGSKKIADLVNDLMVKTGENVKITRFERFEVGN